MTEREKALDMALGQIERQFGKGAIMKMGDAATRKVDVISTGALSLDLALGIGGVPRGRIVEIYGPESSGKTSLALHIVAEAQRNGGIAAFIDAEHALDPGYAKVIGVDVDELLISQPDTGEQALEIADMLIRSGALDVLVIDSVAALVPRAEIEGEMGDSHVGLQARLMSQALRKLAGNLSKSRTTAIFINQLREKIGVMFGCFQYSTRVTLADGSQEKIGKIVNQKLPVEIMAVDPETGAVEPKKIVNWFDNGNADEFLQFTVYKPEGNGKAQFAATANHQISTPGGWRSAGELRAGDRVLMPLPHYLSDQQRQLILGSLMGDGSVSPKRDHSNGPAMKSRFRFGHGPKQDAYALWKADLLAGVPLSISTHSKGGLMVETTPLVELDELRAATYVGGKKVFSWDYLKELTPFALAIWYMDDGSLAVRRKDGSAGRSDICVQAMDKGTQRRLLATLQETHGLSCKLIDRVGKAVIIFDRDGTEALHELVAPYVPSVMEYKLLQHHRGKEAVTVEPANKTMKLTAVPITSIKVKPPTRSMRRFDLEVDGHHNYLVDGVMVHNSPETTPGGRALKFYSSVRLDIRRIETLKDGDEGVGNRVRVKVAKNKCVAEGTTVFDPSTGLTHKIEEIVAEDLGTSVVAADKTGKIHVKPIGARMFQGIQEVVGIGFRSGTAIRVTPDHRLLTHRGWVEAGELHPGDYVARPRQVGTFGKDRPITPEESRLLGYLVGDGYVGGKTPIHFINTAEKLHEDVSRIVLTMGCETNRKGLALSISHRKGEENGVLGLARWAGIHGHLAWEKKLPSAFFADGIDPLLVSEVLFGLWETDGWISREQTGGVRVGFVTTSEQLAHQIHWLLLRFGIGSNVTVHKPGSRRSLINGREVRSKRPCWQVRVSGIDNVRRFAEIVPSWGPRGQILTSELESPDLAAHRGSQMVYLSPSETEPVLSYLEERGVTSREVGGWLGANETAVRGGFRALLGRKRLRRDRLEVVAGALDSEYLRQVLADELWYDRVWEVTPSESAPTYDIEVDELHNFVANDLVIHNCAPPFRKAEFDIMFGEGISREGSLLDIAVDEGVVRKSGAWFTFDDDQLGQGRENAKRFLRENPEIAMQLQDKVYQAVGLSEAPAAPEAAEDKEEEPVAAEEATDE